MNIRTKLTKSAFSLIELMVVIAIVALLAAVAAPAYKSYISKSKMSEVMGFINQNMEAWSEDQSMSQSFTSTGPLGKYIYNIVDNGVGFDVQMVSQTRTGTGLEPLGDAFDVPFNVTINYIATASDATTNTTYKWSCVISTPSTTRVDIKASYFDDCTIP